MANRYDKNQVSLLVGKTIFFDANILIYLFWSSASNWAEREYSSIFGKLLKQKNIFVVDFMVISEIINRVIRIEYAKYLLQKALTNKQLTFKNYRDSQDGHQMLNEINNVIENKLFLHFDIVEKSFNELDIKNLLSIDKLDFNDKALVQICSENNFVLLTNDGDFIAADIDILSANNQLINGYL